MNVFILASIFLIPFVQSEETVDEFLRRNIPHERNRRFVNAQEYLSVADTADYLVRINRKNPTSNTVHTVCSGSIISVNLVLTSGGCLHEDWSRYDKEKRLIPIWQLEVVAGDFNATETESTEQKRTPIQMYIHPQLKVQDHRRMWTNDIAIIEVDTDFEFNDHVNKVELWLSRFALNDSYPEYYTMLKASGFGDSGSHNAQQYDNLFDTFYTYNVTVPQYQYLAYVAKKDGQCVPRFAGSNDVEAGMVTHRPNALDPYTPKPLLTAKRCFYTGSINLAGYIPTSGDYGGPITWRNVDNNLEYQVFLTPWQPESKASFEDDQNYMYWGEVLTYYKDFIGKVFDAAAESNKDTHYPLLTVTSVWQSFTTTMSLEYFNQFQYYVRLDTPAGKFAQVNITLTGENSVNTMRKSVVYVRDSQNKTVLRHFLGEGSTLTESVDVTDGSDGSIGDKWGCTLKDGVPVYTSPTPLPDDPTTNFDTTATTTEKSTTTAVPTTVTTVAATTSSADKRRKRHVWEQTMRGETKQRRKKRELTEDIYTCEDAPVNAAPGTPNTASSFVMTSHWDTVVFNSDNDNDFELDVRINKPVNSADKGTITLEVEYRYITVKDITDVTVNDTCDEGYKLCDDELSCIDPDSVCDFDPDCLDAHDESFWCLDRECLSSEYLCYTGECINLRFLCDGTCDCLDKNVCEDETLLCSESPFDRLNFYQFGVGNAQKSGNDIEKRRSSISADRSEALGHSIDGFLLSTFIIITFLLTS